MAATKLEKALRYKVVRRVGHQWTVKSYAGTSVQSFDSYYDIADVYASLRDALND